MTSLYYVADIKRGTSAADNFNPLNADHFYEFCKFIEISPVGITK
jgi:hypothetical protein